MRVQITVDSASTEQIRALMVALHKAGLTRTLETGVEGPEAWGGQTPKMTTNQFATVIAHLVKFEGTPIADVLDDMRRNQTRWEKGITK